MKAFLLLGFSLFTFNSFALEVCGLKVKVDTLKNAVMAEVVPENEINDPILGQQFPCDQALVEISKNGAIDVELEPGINTPVLYSQSFVGTVPPTLNMSDILGAAIPRLIVINLVFEESVMTIQAVHKKYMYLLER